VLVERCRDATSLIITRVKLARFGADRAESRRYRPFQNFSSILPRDNAMQARTSPSCLEQRWDRATTSRREISAMSENVIKIHISIYMYIHFSCC